MTAKPPARRIWHIAIVLFVVALAALEYWLLFAWAGGSRDDKVGALLAVIGVYGIALGFVARSSGLQPAMRELLDDLTSADAAACLGANLIFLGLVLNLFGLALRSGRGAQQAASPGGGGLAFVGRLLLLAVAVVLLLYVVFHALVVVPMTYPALVLSSAVVQAFVTAGSDSEVVVEQDGQETGSLSLKQLVTGDPLAAKSFIMGLPALVLALVGKLLAPFLG